MFITGAVLGNIFRRFCNGAKATGCLKITTKTLVLIILTEITLAELSIGETSSL